VAPADQQSAKEFVTKALQPTWWVTTGVVLGVLGGTSALQPSGQLLRWTMAGAALIAVVTALRPAHRGSPVLWLVFGLGLGGFRGLETAADRCRLEAWLAEAAEPAVRVHGVVATGWSKGRWGSTTRLRITRTEEPEVRHRLPRHVRFEVRGAARSIDLPPPGTTVRMLTVVRGPPEKPRLVTASPKLLEVLAPPRGLAAARNRIANTLLESAGTRVDRIRSAELTCAILLGRRDLLPRDQQEGWRRSGLAHVLAVSGLHVGLIGGAVWLLALALGTSPTAARWSVLLALPMYTALAGASPSATRACLMGMMYLGARLVGRAVLPVAPVLLAASILLVVTPRLITDPGFHLTVVITAALVRWVPPVIAWLPGPKALTAILVVPVIAQLAAAPIVMAHFRTLVPGAVIANLSVPFLLTPLLLTGIVTALIGLVVPWLAGLGLDVIHGLQGALWVAGGVGRVAQHIVPSLTPFFAVAFVVAGWVSLHAGRHARRGAVTWLALLAATLVWWAVRPGPTQESVRLLPVRDGLAALVTTDGSSILVDGGRHRRSTALLLADQGVRRLTAVIASHSDEDHIGGLTAVFESFAVEQLVIPQWMALDRGSARLLRAARRHGARVVKVARGSCVTLDAARLEVLWPPAEVRPGSDNERSLVARLVTEAGTVLVTSDIGRSTERRLARSSHLSCDVLIAPHHGSRGSSSSVLLDATRPSVVLIPAGPWNLYHHPHREVLERLSQRRIPRCSPAHDGSCAARAAGGSWRIVP